MLSPAVRLGLPDGQGRHLLLESGQRRGPTGTIALIGLFVGRHGDVEVLPSGRCGQTVHVADVPDGRGRSHGQARNAGGNPQQIGLQFHPLLQREGIQLALLVLWREGGHLGQCLLGRLRLGQRWHLRLGIDAAVVLSSMCLLLGVADLLDRGVLIIIHDGR